MEQKEQKEKGGINTWNVKQWGTRVKWKWRLIHLNSPGPNFPVSQEAGALAVSDDPHVTSLDHVLYILFIR